MALRDIKFSKSYRTLHGDVVRDFYLPVLKEAILYKRAVGYFNSQALYDISDGIMHLAKNNGKMQLIVSPQLEKEDIEAIIEGYEARENIVIKAITRALSEPSTQIEKTKLNLLANLIAESVLDIKIALKIDRKSSGIFHEKMGIVEDCEGNKIAFSGSMNETGAGLYNNYETIDIFTDWSCDDNHERVLDKEGAFDSLWNNTDPAIDTFEFPKEAKEWLGKHKEKTTREIIDMGEFLPVHKKNEERPENCFHIPETVKLFDYQKDAISEWMKQESCGIFDMATGTGKTYTALGALCALSKKLNHRMATVIVCPYQHLVEQWVEDIEVFGVNPIIAYGAPMYKKWREQFSDAVNAYKIGVKKGLCIITTNATFTSPEFQQTLAKIKKGLCFVVDEAHNFGAEQLSSMLPQNSQYRLALSATLERHRDEEGTQKLKDFFGEKCIYYPLDKAIQEGALTEYYYHPILVNLSPDEYEKYVEKTRQIAKLGGASAANCEKNPRIEKLLLERSRIIAGAVNKIDALMQAIEPFKNDNHILVYCGATKYGQETAAHEDDMKQIDVICKRLASLGMKVRKFTSSEDKEQRRQIKEDFIEGENLQTIAAIKCLDEGVNIPAIDRAFILASSTNPKEYIQRRGRVLRKFPGKKYAYIYDFITLPRPLDEVITLGPEEKKMELSLIRKEFTRMTDFANTAKNSIETDNLKQLILQEYGAYGDIMEVKWDD